METIKFCDLCGQPLIQQTIWISEEIGFMVYYKCVHCGSIKTCTDNKVIKEAIENYEKNYN